MGQITEYKDQDGDIFRVIVQGEPPAGAAAQATRTIDLTIPLLEKNDRRAERNRTFFRERGLLALNLVSSPGTGKTALLERTLDDLGREVKCAVLVGDLETDRDAQRLHRPHVSVAQITTGSACHLDAEMVARGLEALELDQVRLLFIENVGNLVCPASFDLGEALRVVLLSTTEGEDKPLKYPPIFKSAQVVLLTKIDLEDRLSFDRAARPRQGRRRREKICLAARRRYCAARRRGAGPPRDRKRV